LTGVAQRQPDPALRSFRSTLPLTTVPSWPDHCADQRLPGVLAGVYNERVFRGLDYTIAQATRHGVKVIIALNNYWENSDSIGNVGASPNNGGSDNPTGLFHCICQHDSSLLRCSM
jgi:hypothetical protein